MSFPGGESRASFSERCVAAFERIRSQQENCAVIAHGGTLMAVMEKYAKPAGSYYDYQVRNGEGFLLNEDGSWQKIK